MFKEAHAMRNGQYVQSIGRTVQREAGWQAVRPSSPGTAGQGPCENRCGCLDVPNGLCSFPGRSMALRCCYCREIICCKSVLEWDLNVCAWNSKIKPKTLWFQPDFPSFKERIYTHFMYCYWTKWREPWAYKKTSTPMEVAAVFLWTFPKCWLRLAASGCTAGYGPSSWASGSWSHAACRWQCWLIVTHCQIVMPAKLNWYLILLDDLFHVPFWS